MESWRAPEVPALPGTGTVPAVYDQSARALRRAVADGAAGLYVCGITPYDATHLGHAFTYLAYDTLNRVWRDAGYRVEYTQNTTDIDDPLLERAAATGRDWRELAAEQTALFREDMTALRILPPDHYVGVTEMIDPIAAAVQRLVDDGIGYRVDDDVYFDSAAAESRVPWRLGDSAGLDRGTMLTLSAERGGDPQRVGKHDPLDPLLWRAARPDEPSWPSTLGEGRPGWHIECSVIAERTLSVPLTVAGGGSDLAFPHHEFSTGHTVALSGEPFTGLVSHAGMVGYQGHKMSKSRGNLVFVSALRNAGHDPLAIRLALLAHHYRGDWEWQDADLDAATARLAAWRAWAATVDPDSTSTALLDDLRSVLADDLDTPAALRTVDARLTSPRPSPVELDAIDALLGITLR